MNEPLSEPCPICKEIECACKSEGLYPEQIEIAKRLAGVTLIPGYGAYGSQYLEDMDSAGLHVPIGGPQRATPK